MKKYNVLLILLLLSFSCYAKSTYIPRYFSKIIRVQGEDIDSIESLKQELSYDDMNGCVVSIIHEEVDKERIKSIKRAKAAAGWANFALGLSAFSAGMNSFGNSGLSARLYTDARINMQNSAMLSANASNTANELQQLSVSVLIENNSTNEIYVNDMLAGRIWFIPANSYVTVPIPNGMSTPLRIALSFNSDSQPQYYYVFASSKLNKTEIMYENDDYWVFPIIETTIDYIEPVETIKGYSILNKTTFAEQVVSQKEANEFVRMRKQEDKQKNK